MIQVTFSLRKCFIHLSYRPAGRHPAGKRVPDLRPYRQYRRRFVQYPSRWRTAPAGPEKLRAARGPASPQLCTALRRWADRTETGRAKPLPAGQQSQARFGGDSAQKRRFPSRHRRNSANIHPAEAVQRPAVRCGRNRGVPLHPQHHAVHGREYGEQRQPDLYPDHSNYGRGQAGRLHRKSALRLTPHTPPRRACCSQIRGRPGRRVPARRRRKALPQYPAA